MRNRQFMFQSELPVSAEKAFAWHFRKGALERLIPPWSNMDVLFPPKAEENRFGLKLKWGPFHFKWILERRNCIANQEFSDVQIQGPFCSYTHRHKFSSMGLASCKLSDEIAYAVVLPLLNKKIQKGFSDLFSWRHAILREDLRIIDSYQGGALRILLSGSSGFIGKTLKTFLQLAGHEVIRLVRSPEDLREDSIFWEPSHGIVKKEDFEGFDAVIHLAGGGIAQGRWTKNKKDQLFLSRCRDTWLLSQVLCRLYQPPKVLLCASAVGYYGDRGDEELTEESLQGRGFLAELCGKWEKATEAIENRGTRVIHARFGVVLSARGGALKKMLGPVRLGIGGRIGRGDQWMSWIGIDDLLGAVYHCLITDNISGPVNVVAPHPVRQAEFVRTLATKMGRPAVCHLPGWMFKTAWGEMAKETILSSQKVNPSQLLKTGYVFRYPELKTALDFVM